MFHSLVIRRSVWKPAVKIWRDVEIIFYFVGYFHATVISRSPHLPAGKARCCWQRRNRKGLGLCGCRWSCAIRWIRPKPWSCRGPRTRWAGRPTRRQRAQRWWPRPTPMTGCCWRTMTGNCREGKEDNEHRRLPSGVAPWSSAGRFFRFHIITSTLRLTLRFNHFHYLSLKVLDKSWLLCELIPD